MGCLPAFYGFDSMKIPSTSGLHRALVTATAVMTLSTTATSGEPPVVPMAAWKATYYAPSQIATGLADDLASPTSDTTSNLLKYAYGLTPFDDASSVAPHVGVSGNSVTLQYRRVSAATDLSYDVEISSDLKTWVSAAGTIEEVERINFGEGVDLVTVRVREPVDGVGPRFMRLRVTRTRTDTGGSGMADDWQIRNFGQLGVDPNGDPDGDGISNKAEYLAGTSPHDMFDGFDLVVRPLLTPANQLLPSGIMRVWVGRSDGKPLRNAEVTLTMADSLNAIVDGNRTVQQITVRTDASGLAEIRLSGSGC